MAENQAPVAKYLNSLRPLNLLFEDPDDQMITLRLAQASEGLRRFKSIAEMQQSETTNDYRPRISQCGENNARMVMFRKS